MSLNLTTPLSLYSIPLAYVTAFYPHNVKYRLISKTVGFDNVQPRSHNQENLAKKGMTKQHVDKVARLTGAHQNGNETFPLWAAAVLAANYAGLDERTMNIVSGAFIGLRMLYNYIYIKQTSEGASAARTATFFASLSLPLYLLIKSANKVRLASTVVL